jgi:phosphatidate cytidylyltransferase
MPLGAPLLPGILFRLDAAFVVMAGALIVFGGRKLTRAMRRELWLKLVVYYLVVHCFLILLWLGGWWIRLGLTALALVACSEMLAAQRQRERSRPFELIAYVATAALVLLAPHDGAALWIVGATLLALLSLPVLLLETAHAQERVASTLLAVLVAGVLAMFLDQLRDTHAAEAVFLYLIVVLVDAFTQVGGQLLGRRPWFQTISPRKTLEGALAGFLTCVVGAGLFQALVPLRLSWTVALAILIAICANLGDLAFSALKRSAGLKDFGTLLPAHGGVLDRFDSLLFSGPMFYAALGLLER